MSAMSEKPLSKPEMSEKPPSNPTNHSAVRNVAAAATLSGAETASHGITAAGESHPSAMPSRQAVNTLFTVARTVARAYDSDVDDDDDDDHDDDDDGDKDDDDDDEDVGDMRAGDEELTDQSHAQNASDNHASATSGHSAVVEPSLLNSSLRAGPTPGSTAAGYKFVPEKVKLDNSAASTAGTKTEQAKGITNQSQVTTLPKTSYPSANNAAKLTADQTTSVPESQSATSQVQTRSNTRTTSPLGTTKTATTASAKVDPLAPTAAAPYVYKIVTVKKPDGTIAKVKRPLKAGEKQPIPTPKPPMSTTTKNATQFLSQERTSTGGTSVLAVSTATEKAPPTFTSKPRAVESEKEIEAALLSTHQPAPVKKPVTVTMKDPQTSDAKNAGIQITEKELESGIDGSTPAPTQHDQFKTARRVEKVAKFVVWSVGIMFPFFFLVLAVVTACLNTKVVYNGMEYQPKKDPLSQAITVAASVWPIVFAAIVAQTLKMYAAHQVERGIKLVTLEQLISSHSVGGAIKQPFML